MAGLQVMWRERAIELLEHLGDSHRGQVWNVKPLFVSPAPIETVEILPTDVCRALHTERKAA